MVYCFAVSIFSLEAGRPAEQIIQKNMAIREVLLCFQITALLFQDWTQWGEYIGKIIIYNS